MTERARPRITKALYERMSTPMLEMTFGVLTRMHKSYVKWHKELIEQKRRLVDRGQIRELEEKIAGVRNDSNLKTVQSRRRVIAEELDARANNQ